MTTNKSPGVIVWGEGPQPSPATMAKRARTLAAEGFGDAEIEWLKRRRLTAHMVQDLEGAVRLSNKVYQYRQERRRQVTQLARERGWSFARAAEAFRQKANQEIEEWGMKGFGGLPPDYDAAWRLGYVQYA